MQLSELHRAIVIGMAKNSLSVPKTADELHYSRNNVYYHCEKLARETGYDPRTFYGLCGLLKLVEGQGFEKKEAALERQKGERDG